MHIRGCFPPTGSEWLAPARFSEWASSGGRCRWVRCRVVAPCVVRRSPLPLAGFWLQFLREVWGALLILLVTFGFLVLALLLG